MCAPILAAEEGHRPRRPVTNEAKQPKGILMNARRLSRVILAGVVAAFVVAPAGYAAQSNLVQIDGKLVAPAQLSEAQLAAGHDPSTRLVQIGGALVKPSQVSAWQSNGGSGATWASSDSSSSNFGTVAIAAAAALGGLLLIGSSTIVLRRRRGLATA
jgi:hypothetical protein